MLIKNNLYILLVEVEKFNLNFLLFYNIYGIILIYIKNYLYDGKGEKHERNQYKEKRQYR